MSLEGRVGVITGASSGIGAATARLLGGAGMKLVLNGRRTEQLDAVAAQVDDAVSVAADICDPALPQKLIDTALAEFGRCDMVFNNAGILHTGGIDELNIDHVCEMVRVNVEAAFRVAYVAIRHFKTEGGRGHLIGTSSVLGTKVRPTAGWYAGTKYALEALAEALRMELAGTEIRVCLVEPGLVLTDLHRDWDQPSNVKLGIERPLLPEDVARCVKFVLEQPAHVLIPRVMVLPAEHVI